MACSNNMKTMLLAAAVATCLVYTPTTAFVVFPEADIFSQSQVNLPGRLSEVANDAAIPEIPTTPDFQFEDTPLPVVIWHGLGDSANAEGLKDVASLIDEVHPGTYVHIISVTEDMSGDRQATFFGNVSAQVEYVCAKLATDNILATAPAIDAIGFSQGGQFLRGYIQRCGDWAPRVRSLLTFGSQHNGITEFERCKSVSDLVCRAANYLLKSRTVWSDYVQSHLVPAQYYRDLTDYENYLEHSSFLADINNERETKNLKYAKNLATLEKLVLLVFKDDVTVVPKETGWFDQINPDDQEVVKLKDTPLYKQDWLGLKTLDQKGALVFEEIEGEHMELLDKDLKRLFGKYLGVAGKFKKEGATKEAPREEQLEL